MGDMASRTIMEFLNFDYIHGLAMILMGLVIFWMLKGNSKNGLSVPGLLMGVGALGVLTFFGLQNMQKDIVKFDADKAIISYEVINYDLLEDNYFVEYDAYEVVSVDMNQIEKSEGSLIYYEVVVTFLDGTELTIPSKVKAMYEQEKILKAIRTWLMSNTNYRY